MYVLFLILCPSANYVLFLPKNLVILQNCYLPKQKLLIISFRWNITFRPYLSPKFFLKIQSSLFALCSIVFIAIRIYGPKLHLRQCRLKQTSAQISAQFKYYTSVLLHKSATTNNTNTIKWTQLVICNSLVAWIAQYICVI